MLKVLSLFDGLGGARIALDRLGIPCEYFASEIDKHTIFISEKNYPDIVQLGDVEKLEGSSLRNVHLLIGGSPCQNLSILGDGTGLQGDKSKLFWEYVRLLQEIQPEYFLLENVGSMFQSDEEIISRTLGVKPVTINSNRFTAQNRKRYYWTNIPLKELNTDSSLVIKDILMSKVDSRYYLNDYLEKTYSLLEDEQCWRDLPEDNIEKKKIVAARAKATSVGGNSSLFKKYSILKKAPTATASGLKQKRTRFVFVDPETKKHRYPTEVEYERLQGVPDDYTLGASSSQRYKMVGNGFTIPVIEFLLSPLKEIYNV